MITVTVIIFLGINTVIYLAQMVHFSLFWISNVYLLPSRVRIARVLRYSLFARNPKLVWGWNPSGGRTKSKLLAFGPLHQPLNQKRTFGPFSLFLRAKGTNSASSGRGWKSLMKVSILKKVSAAFKGISLAERILRTFFRYWGKKLFTETRIEKCIVNAPKTSVFTKFSSEIYP